MGVLRRMQSSPAGRTFNYTAESECTSTGKLYFPYVAGGMLMSPVSKHIAFVLQSQSVI